MMPLVVHDVSRCLCWPGYLGRLSLLHSVMTLAQQISSDIQTCSSHKYVAHQTALLYVSHLLSPWHSAWQLSLCSNA